MPRPLYPPRKTRYPLCRRLGGSQGRSGLVWKISLPPGFDPRTIQSIASSYTDCAIKLYQIKINSCILMSEFSNIYTLMNSLTIYSGNSINLAFLIHKFILKYLYLPATGAKMHLPNSCKTF